MYRFDAEVWRWEAQSAWHFVTLPEDISDEIDAQTQGVRAGFGSVRVQVQVGSTTWRTSVFPDTTRGAYVLPLKKAVRDAERLAEHTTAAFALELVT